MEAHKAKILASFKRKYPNADSSKFGVDAFISNEKGDYGGGVVFIINDYKWIDITSDEFKNNPKMTKYLDIIPPYPKLWMSGGGIQPLPNGKLHGATYWGGMKTGNAWYDGYDGYPEKNVLDYPVNNFKIYVSETKYFLSKLTLLKIRTSSNSASKWNDKEDYFRVVFATSCASYCCGISLQHLNPSQDVHPIITSVMRFHLYFSIRRLVRRREVKA